MVVKALSDQSIYIFLGGIVFEWEDNNVLGGMIRLVPSERGEISVTTLRGTCTINQKKEQLDKVKCSEASPLIRKHFYFLSNSKGLNASQNRSMRAKRIESPTVIH